MSSDLRVYGSKMVCAEGTPRPLIMGVVNVTPDSFSDGGRYFDGQQAIDHGMQLVEEGADILDIGGESTRPGSSGVDEAEELRRVLPVIEGLKKRTDRPLSIDTVKPSVARQALERGAVMVNDVSMLRHDSSLAAVAAEYNAELVLMHSRKTPEEMQRDIAYDDVVTDVIAELGAAVSEARAQGVDGVKIWLDPGIGFAKTAAHNLALLARLPELCAMGHRVLVGPSRKSFIGQLTGAAVDDRIGGTAAAVTAAILHGAAAVRVHDVAVMRQTALIAAGINEARHGSQAR